MLLGIRFRPTFVVNPCDNRCYAQQKLHSMSDEQPYGSQAGRHEYCACGIIDYEYALKSW